MLDNCLMLFQGGRRKEVFCYNELIARQAVGRRPSPGQSARAPVSAQSAKPGARSPSSHCNCPRLKACWALAADTLIQLVSLLGI